jgi:hypothetical protein
MKYKAILKKDTQVKEIPVPENQDLNDRSWLQPAINDGWYLYDFVPDVPTPTPVKQTSSLIQAIKKGNVITNPGTWKRLQNFLNGIIPIAVIAGSFIPGAAVVLNPIVLGSIATALGAANVFLTTATTAKIGISP